MQIIVKTHGLGVDIIGVDADNGAEIVRIDLSDPQKAMSVSELIREKVTRNN